MYQNFVAEALKHLKAIYQNCIDICVIAAIANTATKLIFYVLCVHDQILIVESLVRNKNLSLEAEAELITPKGLISYWRSVFNAIDIYNSQFPCFSALLLSEDCNFLRI